MAVCYYDTICPKGDTIVGVPSRQRCGNRELVTRLVELAWQCLNKGIVRDFGHRISFPSEPVCYSSLDTICNTFHSVLLVAEIAGARLVQVEGIC